MSFLPVVTTTTTGQRALVLVGDPATRGYHYRLAAVGTTRFCPPPLVEDISLIDFETGQLDPQGEGVCITIWPGLERRHGMSSIQSDKDDPIVLELHRNPAGSPIQPDPSRPLPA